MSRPLFFCFMDRGPGPIESSLLIFLGHFFKSPAIWSITPMNEHLGRMVIGSSWTLCSWSWTRFISTCYFPHHVQFCKGTTGCEQRWQAQVNVDHFSTRHPCLGGFIHLTLRILGLSMAWVGPSIAGVRALKTLSVGSGQHS